MRRGILVGLAALLLAGAPALAEERTRSYGGSGADRLTRLIEYGDGLIAVGRTDSRNGDLAMRTRHNQAGWMLCLNGEGAPLWSYCTAKDGRNEMSAPFAHENGQISAVLIGRGIDGLEWLIVSGEGRLAQRRTAPAVETVCAHGGTDMIGMPYDRDGAPHLALIVEHGDGACCVADLDADGRLAQGAGFPKGTAGFAPCVDGSGRLVSADCAGGEAGVMLVTPGTDDAPVRIPLSGVTAEAATAVLALEDGSTVVGGKRGGGGFLARVNALGETLFAVATDAPLERLAANSSGFVGQDGARLVYFDEDGRLLGSRTTGYDRDAALGALEDMAGLSGETALLMDAERVGGGRAEIVFVPDEGIEAAEEEYNHVLYMQPGCVMKDAWARESGVLLLLEREDGRQSGVYVSADGDTRETDAPTAREAGRQAVSGGVLAWREERGGAVVTLEDAQGGEIWRLRTVIHTAADRLEWRCALELPDGSYALGGRYLTGEGQRTEQAAALAVVGREGVLRRIVPVEAKEAGQRVGCVCDMAYDAESGLLLLVSRTEDGAENVGAIQTADGETAWTVGAGMDVEQARLILDADGEAYLCGTSRSDGQSAAAVIRMDLEAEDK